MILVFVECLDNVLSCQCTQKLFFYQISVTCNKKKNKMLEKKQGWCKNSPKEDNGKQELMLVEEKMRICLKKTMRKG